MVVGGLVMIAIAGAIRELRRIAQALNRPAPAPRFPRPGEPIDPHAPGQFRPGMTMPRTPPMPAGPLPAGPMPSGPMPSGTMPPPPAGPEGGRDRFPRDPRLALAASPEPVPELKEPTAPSLQPQESLELQESQQLQESQESQASQELQASQEPHAAGRAEPSAAAQGDAATPSEREWDTEAAPLLPGFEHPQEVSQPEDQSEPDRDPETVARVETAVASAPSPQEPDQGSWTESRRSPFDAIWPARARVRAAPPAEDDAEGSAPSADEAAVAQAKTDADPDEVSAPSVAPTADPDGAGREEDATDAGHAERAEPAFATDRSDDTQPPDTPHPVSILKSGVVDGMAYTLYSDGSIEAQLPSGTLRFASLSELREHLERTG
jgi:hypothetical protein